MELRWNSRVEFKVTWYLASLSLTMEILIIFLLLERLDCEWERGIQMTGGLLMVVVKKGKFGYNVLVG